MSRTTVEQALHELTKARGWDVEGLDEDGCVILEGGEDLPVVVTLVPGDSPAVVLYAEIGEPADALVSYRQALRAMHLWRADDNVTLGVHPDRDSLTACMALPIDQDFAVVLAAAFDHFSDRAAHWMQRLAAGDGADSDGASGDATTAGPDMPGAGAFRV